MRGTILVFIMAVLLAAGCTGQAVQVPANASNQSAAAPVEECDGPVCGADNVTYSTDCEAALADVSILYDGACIEPVAECIETDGGLEPETAGSVAKGEESYSDYCLDEHQVVEYACLDGSIQMNTVVCGEGKVCAAGACGVPEPEENDTPPVVPGCQGPIEADILVSETTIINGVAYNDSCVDYTTVKDYFCKDNKMESINHECPPGYGCGGGSCFKLPISCTETDGGNDTTTRGKITVLKGLLTTFSETDTCIDDVKIKEYMCLENGSYTFSEFPCPSGTKCLYDRCIESKCREGDGGSNIYTWGVTRTPEGDFEDECLSDHTLREYYCYGDDARYDDIDCGKGFICSENNHKCVEGSVD